MSANKPTCPAASRGQASDSTSSVVDDAVNQAVMKELTRRGLIQGAALGAGVMLASSWLSACKPRSEQSEFLANGTTGGIQLPGGVTINGVSFYDDIGLVIAATPITADPQTDLANFKAQAGARGKAIGAVIGFWLQAKPYSVVDKNGQKVRGLFDELFENRATKPVFQPQIGPVIVFQHPHVVEVLSKTDTFKVDPYSPMMKMATSGAHYAAAAGQVPSGTPQNPQGGFYDHFILGTDDDRLYTPDSLICRKVVQRSDIGKLRPLIRNICESLVDNVEKDKEFDVVQSLCRFAPVGIVGLYLGLPSYPTKGQGGVAPFSIDGLVAGDKFPIDDDLKGRFKFQVVQEGVVPDYSDMYLWIKDAFRNIFNNFGRDQAFAAMGLEATERLLIWSSRVIKFYKGKMEQNGYKVGTSDVPDTMITRLLKLQHDARNPKLQQKLMAELGCQSVEELLARTGDDRVQVNAFGTFVGAVANPEEANARIIQSALLLREGKIKSVRGGGTYAALKKLADDADSGDKNMVPINRYAIELLRLNPQGEVLLRLCAKDTTIGGVTIKAGTLVFNAHGAAMHDPETVKDPESLDINRDRKEVPYHGPGDARTAEAPQSSIYLHHGFGRHKCLGRYASEITMEEVLRAMLRLGDPTRVGDNDLKMDNKNLYAESFIIKAT